jgi:pyruvate kinase
MDRAAKIICTLGPASQNYETIAGLVRAGMDVARLNFSHGQPQDHLNVIRHIRRASKEVGRPVGILQDLQGPKIRVGTFKTGSAELKTGNRFTITTRPVDGNDQIVSTTYEALAKDVKPGNLLLLDDGLIYLRALETDGEQVICEVVNGGTLKNSKGINLPGVAVSAPSMTEKDRVDLEFGLQNDVDFVALSFVRKAADIQMIKELIRKRGKKTPVIAKIEKPEALECIDDIIAVTDGLMVARGDLGVEMKTEEVPPIQKRLIAKCNKAGIPVITATQMLDSMVQNPRPTRAEASDVANAILDGTDAVMLSAETASGKYPIETVTVMKQIIALIEKEMPVDYLRRRRDSSDQFIVQEGIAVAACSLAEMLDADAIVAITLTGAQARVIARYRPQRPIIAVTHDEEVQRQLTLIWGVRGVILPDMKTNIDDSVNEVKNALVGLNILKKGHKFIITAGLPFSRRGATNSIRVETID